MIWFVLFLLARSNEAKPAARPVPVITRGELGLWLVRELGGGVTEVSSDLDQVVCTFEVDRSGARLLRSTPPNVDRTLLGKAILDFKLREPPTARVRA